MAQAYVTTYSNCYRRHDVPRRESLKQTDTYAESFPDGDIWLIPSTNDRGNASITAAERAIQKMLRNRLWSIYQVDYCRDHFHKDESELEGSFENELFEYSKNLYGKKIAKVPVPLPTSKRLFGYMKPRFMYTPSTTYQEDIGRIGYNILKEAYETKENTPNDIIAKCKSKK